MNDLNDARKAAWFSARVDEHPIPRDVFNARLDAGARWAIRTSSKLSPHVAKFIELLVLLGFTDAE